MSLPSIYQDVIHITRYSRWDDEKCKRETWPETVERYIQFMCYHQCKDKLSESEIKEIREAICGLEVMPSMRCLMTAGPALARDNAAGFNCTGLIIDSLEAFDEMMYLLMCGCGVGFSVERQFIDKLPAVAPKLRKSPSIIKVGDSRIGWANALRELISLLYQGRIPDWDVSDVRPAGARLKTFGGRASGARPLVDLFNFLVTTFKNAAGRKLTSVECHDISCKIAEVVVAGGVRRSATISLSNLSDDRMRNAKSGQWWETTPWRSMANNSAAYTEKPGMRIWFKEWQALYDSQSGERGVFNREAAKKHIIRHGRRDPEHDFVTNPCLTGDMLVSTSDGVRYIDDLVSKSFVAVIHGERIDVPGGFFKTGHKDVYRVTTDRGYYINATDDHKISVKTDNGIEDVPLNMLKVGDQLTLETINTVNHVYCPKQESLGWLVGYVLGNGGHNPGKYPTYLRFWKSDGGLRKRAQDIVRACLDPGSSYKDGHTTDDGICTISLMALTNLCNKYLVSRSKTVKPDVMRECTSFRRGFIRGLFDADGSVQGSRDKGVSIRLSQSDVSVLEVVQQLLIEFGVLTTLYKNRRGAGYRVLPDGKGGHADYNCASDHELVISRESMDTFMRNIGFWHTIKSTRYANINAGRRRDHYADSSVASVVSVEYIGCRDVYDCTVNGVHHYVANGIVVHNCGEIILRPCQMCNLSEVVVRTNDSIDDLKRKIKLAVILGTMQATLTDFQYLRDIWRTNVEEEALLGVSLTGVMDHHVLSGKAGKKELNSTLASLREYAVECNKKYAKIIGVNEATAVTTVKPSGCRPWYALTATDRGLLTLEELLEDHDDSRRWCDVKHPTKALQGGSSTAVTKTYVNGKVNVKRIKLTYGLELDCTDNHRWWVIGHRGGSSVVKINDWYSAAEIKPGDILDINIGVYNSTKQCKLVKISRTAISMREDADNINQPDYMCDDLAWFLGYLWGDGAMSPSKYRIRFIDANVNNLKRAQAVLIKCFGLSTNINLSSECRNAHVLEIGSKMLWHWLIRNDVWKYFTGASLDIIPRVVRSSSRDNIIAFLAGMFDADGWCGSDTNNKYVATFTTASREFAAHVQHVGWSVGLAFGLSHNGGGKNYQRTKSMYLMSVSTLTDPGAFAVFVRCSSKLSSLQPDGYDPSAWRPVVGVNRLKCGMVKSVSDIGEMPTYDIETSSHWYYAGAVKSHNTVSQLVDCASGLHPRWSRYYIRTIRGSLNDPVTRFLIASGIPYEASCLRPDTEVVFSFPIQSPEAATTVESMSAVDQLELWRSYREHWCEHQPSITVYVRDHEWMEVGAWVYKYFDSVGGLSFLPASDHVYVQAPYQTVTESEYNELLAKMPTSIDWSRLSEYERDDTAITSTREFACVGGACEVTDIGVQNAGQ